MRGVHVVADPDAGVGHPQLGVGEGACHRAEGPSPAGSPSVCGSSAAALERAAASTSGRASWWSWLPATQRDAAPGHGAVDLLEHGPRGRASRRRRSLAQLHDVAEEHELVHVRQRLEQLPERRSRGGAGRARRGAEVQVGDDRRGHGQILQYPDAPQPCHRSSADTTASPPTARSARRARSSISVAEGAPPALLAAGDGAGQAARAEVGAGRREPRASTRARTSRAGLTSGSRRCRAACVSRRWAGGAIERRAPCWTRSSCRGWSASCASARCCRHAT